MLKEEGSSFLLPCGRVSMDERMNTLLIQETYEKIQAVEKLIKKLDMSFRQVMFEMKIVATNNDLNDVLDIRFLGAGKLRVGSRAGGSVATGGCIDTV